MIFFLIGCSILLALLFLAAFFWASKSGQHDDTYTPAVRILFDDDVVKQENEKQFPQDKEKDDEDHI